MLKGGEAVVESMIENGVNTVFGLPGSEILEIYEALRKSKQVKHVSAMHELNAAYMADAYGRLTGEPGVCLCSAGPGATNAVTGIAQAYTEASPVLQVTGHPSRGVQPDHCVDDWDFLLDIYKPITKWSSRIGRFEDIADTISKGYHVAKSGRFGPVHIQVPQNIVDGSGSYVSSGIFIDGSSSEVEVSGSLEVLESALRPIIVVGRGVLREFCTDQVVQSAERLGAPIVTLQSAIGAIPFDCPYYLGYDLAGVSVHPLIKPFISSADVVLALGFDLGERLTLNDSIGSTIVHVYRDDRVNEFEGADGVSNRIINLNVSVRRFLSELIKDRPKEVREVEKMKEEISSTKRRIKDDIESTIKWGKSPLHPGEISSVLRRALDDDAIVTLDEGSSSYWMRRCFKAKAANSVLVPGRYRSMGFSLPAAIAAKHVYSDRQVVSVTGDGGFLMSYMDFPTLVKYNLDVVVVVESNRHYGMMWQLQRSRYRGQTYETEVQVPDFSEYAQAFGATGYKVRSSEELVHTFDEALSCKGPVLVDVETDHKPSYYTANKAERFFRRFKYLGKGS